MTFPSLDFELWTFCFWIASRQRSLLFPYCSILHRFTSLYCWIICHLLVCCRRIRSYYYYCAWMLFMTHGQPTKESANHFDVDRGKWKILQCSKKCDSESMEIFYHRIHKIQVNIILFSCYYNKYCNFWKEIHNSRVCFSIFFIFIRYLRSG